MNRLIFFYRKNKLFFICVFTFFIGGQISAQEWLWQISNPGNYVPGYIKIISKNYERPYTSVPISPRTLPIHIWYPARSGTNKGMTYMDYVKSDQNATWDGLPAYKIISNWTEQYLDSAKVTDVSLKLAKIKTASVVKAKAAPGKFPVILMGNGLTSPGFVYSLMGEYFASHGFVVVSYPSLPENSTSRFGFDQRGILNQISDIEMVYNEIAKLAFCDIENLALVAWSFGGASHILYQMKHNIAKALVSLDAASQYAYGKDLIVSSVYYDSSSFSTPYLNITAGGPSRFEVPRSSFFYDTLAVNKKHLTFSRLSHSHFVAFNQYIIMINQPDQKVKNAYEKMCEVIKLYLQAILVNRRDSNIILSSLPAHID